MKNNKPISITEWLNKPIKIKIKTKSTIRLNKIVKEYIKIKLKNNG